MKRLLCLALLMAGAQLPVVWAQSVFPKPLMGAVEMHQRDSTRVRLVDNTRRGFFVPVMVNHRVVGTFMIDTAASHTVISQKTAKEAGIWDHNLGGGYKSIITAAGPTQLPFVITESLKIGALDLKNMDVIVQDLEPSLNIDGLIGLDILQYFDFSIADRALTLKSRN